MYYWYGTLRNNHTWGGPSHSPGINCYSSTDLYNWHYEGLVFAANATHTTIDVQRPKVIYNKKTSTYVLWTKVYNSPEPVDGSGRAMAVAVSKSAKGPFHLANGVPHFVVDGKPTGDATLFVDDDDHAYLVFRSAGKSDKLTHVYQLTPDYTNVTTTPAPATVGNLEGVTMFKYAGRYYVWGSGLSPYPAFGKLFNTHAAVFVSANGPLGAYVPAKKLSKNSFDTFAAQSTFVLPNPAAGHNDGVAPFIWMGDAWLVHEVFFGYYTWLPLYVNATDGRLGLEWRDSWKYETP